MTIARPVRVRRLPYVLWYSLVNLVAREIEVYREPRPDGTWGRVTRGEPHSSLAPLALPDLIISASQILGQV
jgi:Uma2 family endonuclease